MATSREMNSGSLQCSIAPGDPESPAPFHLGHRGWLDGLRGLAILLVLAFHFGLLAGGFLGVDLFFVLSGFLITNLLVEEWQRRGAISLKYFYLRRALRLLPAFFALLLVCGIYSLWLPTVDAEILRRAIVVAGCYLANWPALHYTGLSILGHTWSLSVEEQFYLLWPVILYAMLRLKLSRRRILLVVLAGILASAALRMGLYQWGRASATDAQKEATILRLYMGLDTRADALLVGCLLALLASWGLLPQSRRAAFWLRAAALVSVVVFAYVARYRCLDHSQFYHGLFTAVALMAAVVIAHLLATPTGVGARLLQCDPLVGLGRISYGLYLFHSPIVDWLKPRELGWGHPGNTLLAFGLSLAAALLSYYGLERPCLRLRERFRPRNLIEVGGGATRRVAA